jgi:hypothetical protein
MLRTRLNVGEIPKFGMFHNAKLSSTSYRLLIVIDPTITINQSKLYRLIDNQPAKFQVLGVMILRPLPYSLP